MRNNEARPILKIPGKDWFILLTHTGEWAADHPNGFVIFTSPKTCMCLLSILDNSFDEINLLVEDSLLSIGIDKSEIKSFPYTDTLICALQWETDYWPSLAIQWLEDGFPLTDELIDNLVSISKGNLAQNLKHGALRLVKQYEQLDIS